MTIEIVPFEAALIPQGAALLAVRHANDRLAASGLPVGGEAVEAARAALTAAWARPMASGAAVVANGQLVGYLVGDLAIDTQRGRTAWVRQAGQALAAGQEHALLRDLYAMAATRWVDLGCCDHFVLAPTADRAVLQTWFGLSFGLEQVHALADLEAVRLTPPELGPALTLRRAGPEDAERLAGLAGIIRRHQAAAPVWGAALPEHEAEIATGYRELVSDPTATVWLALRGEEALAFQAYYTTEPGPADLLTPERCVELSVAGTVPAAQGLGLGRALTALGFAAARAAGQRYVLADWRSTNLSSARFWPRQGFVPVVYRMVRRVDGRSLWAR